MSRKEAAAERPRLERKKTMKKPTNLSRFVLDLDIYKLAYAQTYEFA